jgi:sarcosine oxidase, subunit beta
MPGAPGVVVGMVPQMGFTAGPLLGRTLADLALGKSPGRDLSPFAPDRF